MNATKPLPNRYTVRQEGKGGPWRVMYQGQPLRYSDYDVSAHARTDPFKEHRPTDPVDFRDEEGALDCAEAKNAQLMMRE